MNQEAKVLLIVGTLIVLLLIGAAFLFGRSSGNPAATDVRLSSDQMKFLVKPDSHQTATSSAKVTVVEFGDFQCPACGLAYPIIRQMQSDYKDKANLVFRNFPLSQHQNAQVSAEAAEAAGDQGKFWQMYDKLYQNQSSWSDSQDAKSIFIGYAKELNLDVSKFSDDLNSHKFASRVQNDYQDGVSLGINATPTFFINGLRIAGVPTYEKLKQTLDLELSK